ncbi:DUF1579 family protein [Mucilaginibacter rubeus]|uniref:DUF1579 domain-containing protein n=1 Tax=Mucilaginibacter rubeus TaxID=2027860 RepID=A0A5C1HSV8_9SPHI|nr:DUF1579 family protein [Mucilaginibacter rubeus]QEM08924.1 DUF1579 domain-containing protein [Mucilaginibacter rubeus]
MKYLLNICLVLLITFLGTTSFAQAKNDMAELSKTNANHQILAQVKGEWAFTGKHTFAGGKHKPIEFAGSMTGKDLWDGRYFTTEVTGQDIPMPWSDGKLVTLHETMLLGYDNVKKKFVASYINNEFETGIIPLEGSYDSATKVITYDGETLSPPQPNLPSGAMRKFHALLKFIDNDHYILEWHEGIGGKELFDTVLNFTRK